MEIRTVHQIYYMYRLSIAVLQLHQNTNQLLYVTGICHRNTYNWIQTLSCNCNSRVYAVIFSKRTGMKLWLRKSVGQDPFG